MTEQSDIHDILARLIIAFEEQADVIISEQKRPPDEREEIEAARSLVRPVFTFLAERLGHDPDGLEAIWRLISCTTTIVDPDKNKAGLVAAAMETAKDVNISLLNQKRAEKRECEDAALEKAVKKHLGEDAGRKLDSRIFNLIWTDTHRNLGAEEDQIKALLKNRTTMPWPSRSSVNRKANAIRERN